MIQVTENITRVGKKFEIVLCTCLFACFTTQQKIVEAQGISEEMPNYNDNLGKYFEELELCPNIPESQEEKDQTIKRT